jgi:hypothetical protein
MSTEEDVGLFTSPPSSPPQFFTHKSGSAPKRIRECQGWGVVLPAYEHTSFSSCQTQAFHPTLTAIVRLFVDTMKLHPFFQLRASRSPGAAAAHSGFAFERAVHTRLLTLLWKGESVRLSDPAGANKSAHDIIMLNNGLTLEAKTKKAAEGGGCTMRLIEGVFQFPTHSILRSFIPPDLVLWDGRVPSFLMGDRSVETWTAEKDSFKGVYLPASSSAVADYYRAKGTMYMQIGGRGLYHTGEDVLGWGVPKFEPECKVRIRLKPHKGSVPQDCQACFNYKPATLPPTPYDLMDVTRLPPGFTQGAE